KLWFNGPTFLITEADYPDQNIDTNVTMFTNITDELQPAKVTFLPLIAVERFSGLKKLIHVTVMIRRACNIFKSLIDRNAQISPPATSPVSRNEYSIAMNVIVRQEQQRFHEKLENEAMFYIDEKNTFRFRNRIDEEPPVVLPKESHFTDLIFNDTHQRLLHSGPMHTLSIVREQFWIPNGRSYAKRQVRNCLQCRHERGPAFELPEKPMLPDSRKTRSYPFEHCGIDYFGPFDCKSDNGIIKVWGLLLTCFTTRAIHIDTVKSLSSNCLIRSLRKFIARHGTPKTMLSDNAKQFHTTDKALQAIWTAATESRAFQNYCDNSHIQWKFIVERAPWQGGVYERMVKSIKDPLRSAIGRRRLHIDDFEVLLTEIEAIVNTRPLTYTEAEEGTVLRPIDLLNPNVNLGIPHIDSDLTDPDYQPSPVKGPESLFEVFQQTTAVLDKYWDIFSKRYISELKKTPFAHNHPRSTIKRAPANGEVVIIFQESTPRAFWPLGRIIQLIPSHDNEIRAVELMIASGKTIRRPVSHLVPLELLPSPRNVTTSCRE
ncbi:hypothetical protein NEOKW01_2139, partial [Nematocida sp. AWRm80]